MEGDRARLDAATCLGPLSRQARPMPSGNAVRLGHQRREILPQVREDLLGGTRLVQRVEMDARCAAAKQALTLRHRPVDADALGAGTVLAGGFEIAGERWRDAGAAELGHALDLRPRKRRHDAGNDSTVDADPPRAIDESEVVVVHEEEL